METDKKWYEGWKTYLSFGIVIVLAGLVATGKLTQQMSDTVMEVLIAIGVMTASAGQIFMRSAVKRETQKAASVQNDILISALSPPHTSCASQASDCEKPRAHTPLYNPDGTPYIGQ